MNTITRDGLSDRLRALAQDEIDGVSAVLSPGNSHDVLTAADEIDRLRLTDAECAELDGIISDFSEIAEFNEERCHPNYANQARRRVATLRGLLERLGGER